jgi:hypothetical protein
MVTNAFYGTPPFQIDEGYSGMELNVGSDVTDIIKELFARIGVADKAYSITKNFCGYGDEFFENIFSKNGKKILSINTSSPCLSCNKKYCSSSSLGSSTISLFIKNP